MLHEVDTDLVVQMYTEMLRIRVFEEMAADLIEKGDIKCPCHLYIGQEAIAVGVCLTLDRKDTIWGGHRSHGHYLAKGGNLRSMMAELFGKVDGCSRGRGGSMHLFDPDAGILGTVPLVAATIPLAVGAGLASKLRKSGEVAVAFFGDGATEEGHYHESVNLAACHKIPVVFVCENNFYSSHMHLSERRVADNIYLSGEVHGAPGVQIDGNDVIKVYQVATEAVDRARSGGGPSVIECHTFRWRGHVGPKWDEDVGLKRRGDLKDWLNKDPLKRTLTLLIEQHGIAEEAIGVIDEAVRREVDESVDLARSSAPPAVSELYEHLYVSKEGSV